MVRGLTLLKKLFRSRVVCHRRFIAREELTIYKKHVKIVGNKWNVFFSIEKHRISGWREGKFTCDRTFAFFK